MVSYNSIYDDRLGAHLVSTENTTKQRLGEAAGFPPVGRVQHPPGLLANDRSKTPNRKLPHLKFFVAVGKRTDPNTQCHYDHNIIVYLCIFIWLIFIKIVYK